MVDSADVKAPLIISGNEWTAPWLHIFSRWFKWALKGEWCWGRLRELCSAHGCHVRWITKSFNQKQLEMVWDGITERSGVPASRLRIPAGRRLTIRVRNQILSTKRTFHWRLPGTSPQGDLCHYTHSWSTEMQNCSNNMCKLLISNLPDNCGIFAR